MMLNPAWHYHFLGIGGVGMSAIAELLHRRGFRVSGSDVQPSATLDALAAAGIPVAVGHAPEQLDGVQAVVFTSAIPKDHPIWQAVAARKLPRLHRAEVLAELTRGAQALAVAGTHGKTTSTAALAAVLEAAGWDPTALIGGHVPQFGNRNLRVGESPWLVVEADESDGSFGLLSPWATLLTNVDADHLDQHGTMDKLEGAFAAFLARLPAGQLLVYCRDDPRAARLAADGPWQRRSYGTGPEADVRVAVAPRAGGGMTVRLTVAGEPLEFASPLAGAHNGLNLAGVFALAEGIGVPREAVLRGLAGFQGVARRQQFLGEAFGCRIFDDYAHHPAEIEATLRMFREFHCGPITVVFQPHLYSRTAQFAEAFAEALRPAARVLVTDVYGAREPPVAGVDGRTILKFLAGHPGASHLPAWQELLPIARAGGLEPGLLITMGAGDITGLGPLLLAEAARP